MDFQQVLLKARQMLQYDKEESGDSEEEFVSESRELDTHTNDHLDFDHFIQINKYMFTTYSTDHHDVRQSVGGIIPYDMFLSKLEPVLRLNGFFHVCFNPFTLQIHSSFLPIDAGVCEASQGTIIPFSDGTDIEPDELFHSIALPDLDGDTSNPFVYGYHLARVKRDGENRLIIPGEDKYIFPIREAEKYLDRSLFNSSTGNLLVAIFIEDMLSCRQVLYGNLLKWLQ
jgi:hypothetical protein